MSGSSAGGRRCTDSFGEGEALRSCSSGSSGHPGRLIVLIGPDLRDHVRLTYQRLLNACVNTPTELHGSGGSVRGTAAHGRWRAACVCGMDEDLKASIGRMLCVVMLTSSAPPTHTGQLWTARSG